MTLTSNVLLRVEAYTSPPGHRERAHDEPGACAEVYTFDVPLADAVARDAAYGPGDGADKVAET